VSKLLVLSNGAGEDAIAKKILRELPEELRSRVVCCPLVGPGRALEEFEICGPRVLPPSEGLFRESWRLALKDLTQGVIGGHFRQLKFLREVEDRVALTVAVGDLFPVIWAALAGSKRIFFVGTAKSVYHHPYSLIERWILKRFVGESLVRDQATAERLSQFGLPARWLGNAMMDEVQPSGAELPFSGDRPVLTLFPGSRAKAPETLAYQLKILREVEEKCPIQAGVALAPGTESEALVQPSVRDGWHYSAQDESLTMGDSQVYLLAGRLGDLLSVSSVALGQAGTANEQAAGAGVPVVAYDPKGERGLRWYRKRQKGLLGDAVSVVKKDVPRVASELIHLLRDDAERERRAQIGRERMGPLGGCRRMADAIAQMWNDG
jgi:uncharacterized protein (TIGR03492 family)